MIFEDPTQGRRKKAFYISIGFIIIVGTLILVTFFLMSLVKPTSTLNLLNLKSQDLINLYSEKTTKLSFENQIDKINYTFKKTYFESNNSNQKYERDIKKIKVLPPMVQKPFLHTIFIKQDELNIEIFKNNLEKIDMAFPDWLSLNALNGSVNEKINWEFFELLNKNKVIVFPTFSIQDSLGQKRFSSIINSETKSDYLINDLKYNIKNRSVKGINIDIDNINPIDSDFYIKWLIKLVKSFHNDKLYVIVSVRMDNVGFDYKNLGLLSDKVVIKAFNEHFEAGKPGPIASEGWFIENINKILELISPKKTIIALSSFGYDWNTSKKRSPEMSSFERIIYLADSVKAKIWFDNKSNNSNFSYKTNDGRHEVWFLDATTVWNQYLFLNKKFVSGVSLWGINKIDDDIWKFFSKYTNGTYQIITFKNLKPSTINLSYPVVPFGLIKSITINDNTIISCPDIIFDPKNLSNITNSKNLLIKGTPNIFKIISLKKEGERKLSFSGKIIKSINYLFLPRKLVISGLDKKQSNIALVFDGSLSKENSKKILEILKRNKIFATFFPTISQMEENPEIVKQQYNDGHIIGNQVSVLSSKIQLKNSIDKSQNNLKYISGHKSFLVKSPYKISSDLEEKNIKTLYDINEMGYLLISADIDVNNFKNPSGTVKNIVSKINNGSIIISIHDPMALEELIPILRSKGFNFVTVSDLLGVQKNILMPTISYKEKMIVLINSLISWFGKHSFQFVAIIFLTSTGISILRIIFLGLYVFHGIKTPKKYYSNRFLWGLPKKYFVKKFLKMPPVTILVPAYNEEKVIKRTILGLLKSDYPDFTILVIDDGSKDKTALIVKRLIKKFDNIRLISKKNEGKSLALNLGFKEATTEFIVTIDADTITFPYTITNLIEPFSDDRIDSVCGNIGVGNVKNILTAFQEVEYITGQNFDRRAFDALNSISVVPGATGAWRREKVLEIGGYSSDTLVEDADLTLTLLENNGHIVYAPMAKSVTEAPETVRALFKQRFRWGYGTFQCFWKHRKTFGKGALGIIALPNMIISQLFQNIFSPIGDLIFIISLFMGNFSGIMINYWIFFLMDAFISGVAYVLDKKPLRHAWVILIQRFFYRQFMYFVTFSSIIAAFLGTHHGWNKLERKGTVKVIEK